MIPFPLALIFAGMFLGLIIEGIKDNKEETIGTSLLMGIGIIFVIISAFEGVTGFCQGCDGTTDGCHSQVTQTFECYDDAGALLWSDTLGDDVRYYEDGDYAYTYRTGEEGKHICKTQWKIIDKEGDC